MKTNEEQRVVNQDKITHHQLAKIIKEFNQIASVNDVRRHASATQRAIFAYRIYKALKKDKSARMTITEAAEKGGISRAFLNMVKGIYEMSNGEMPYSIGKGSNKKMMLTKEKTKEALEILDIENQMDSLMDSKSAKFSFSPKDGKTLFKYLEEPRDTNSIAAIYDGIRLLLEDMLLTEPPIKNADYEGMLHTEEAKSVKHSNNVRLEAKLMIIDILNSL